MPVAHILDLKGNWQVNGRPSQAKSGQALYAGADVSIQDAAGGDFITILRDRDFVRLPFVCPRQCREPIRVQPDSTSKGPSVLQALKVDYGAAMNLLLNKQPAIASASATPMSRTISTTTIAEDVLTYDPTQGISLSNTLTKLPAGSYTISAVAVGDEHKAVSQTLTHFEEGGWQSFQISPGFGIYRVYVDDANQTAVADLLLLLVPRSQYIEKRGIFDAVKSRTATWEGMNARSDEHRLLRAVLLELSK
jgi:hypothetical protein